MRFRWLKIFLLGTFAFWACGAAKFAHEQIEHHGRDASSSLDDDDDDDDAPVVAASNTAAAAPQTHPKDSHSHHPCPVCQMLAAMTVDRSQPPALPQVPSGCIAVLAVTDWIAPHLYAQFTLPARGPPAI